MTTLDSLPRGRLAQLALTLVALGAIASCERGPVRVLLIGDSITAGMTSAPPGPPYALLLAELLGPGLELERAACGGTTVRHWLPDAAPLRRCTRRVTSAPATLYATFVEPALPVDLAVVVLGVNDAMGFAEGRVPAGEYGKALRELATSLLADGADRVLLVAPPPVFHRQSVFARLVQEGREQRAICAGSQDVVCGPDLLRLLKRDDYGGDSLHPNGAGHAKIATALAQAIRELHPQR
jgi:lysophospholipase L1-like esterase